MAGSLAVDRPEVDSLAVGMGSDYSIQLVVNSILLQGAEGSHKIPDTRERGLELEGWLVEDQEERPR